MNTLNVINAYKHGPMWVFDEPNYNLVKEPFVAGADTFLDYATDNGKKVTLLFSVNQFPGSQFQLRFTNDESGGGYYTEVMTNREMWLCAATRHYFQGEMPKVIYVQCVMNTNESLITATQEELKNWGKETTSEQKL
tara:strand:+ start:230 stop:640 length:411 start_codon:yes stop_codon:yes gene_type:complete